MQRDTREPMPRSYEDRNSTNRKATGLTHKGRHLKTGQTGLREMSLNPQVPVFPRMRPRTCVFDRLQASSLRNTIDAFQDSVQCIPRQCDVLCSNSSGRQWSLQHAAVPQSALRGCCAGNVDTGPDCAEAESLRSHQRPVPWCLSACDA